MKIVKNVNIEFFPFDKVKPVESGKYLVMDLFGIKPMLYSVVHDAFGVKDESNGAGALFPDWWAFMPEELEGEMRNVNL